MRMPAPLCRLTLALAAVLALATGCTPRQERAPAPKPVPQVPIPTPAEPSLAPSPEPGPAPDQALTDPERDIVLFTIWHGKHSAEVDPFSAYLVSENLAQVVPTYQLLRSASMWKECHAEPFEVPPTTEWEKVRDVLILLRELHERQVLPGFEVVSAYRDPRLNRCAGGAPGSSHQKFAVDIAPLSPEVGAHLCRFWREEGRKWNMGVSRYPSGRIHIDRTGYRTWGATHKRGSSYCL
jgi:hypothetical protein